MNDDEIIDLYHAYLEQVHRERNPGVTAAILTHAHVSVISQVAEIKSQTGR